MAVFQTKFARVIRLNLEDCQASEYEPLFQHLSASNPLWLEDLNLGSSDLTAIPIRTITDVLSNMKRLSLGGTRLSNDQWIKLLTTMSEMNPLRLEEIRLSNYPWNEAQSLPGRAIGKVLG